MGTPSRRKRRSNQARITRFFQRDAVIRELEIARRSYYMLNLDQAEQALRKALRIATGHPEATILLSDLLLKAGKPREAYSLLLESVRANPKEALLYLELAQAALHVGRLSEAEKAVLKFLAILDRHPTQLRGERTELTLTAKRILRSLRQHAPADSRQEQATPREPVQRSLFSRAPAPSGRVVRPASTTIVDTAHPIAPPSSSAAGTAAGTAVGTAVSPAGNPRQLVRFDDEGAGSPAPPAPRWIDDPWSEDLDDRELLLESQRIGLLSHYEELLCLDAVTGVRRLEFQVETARKILRRLNGRALLCDEVGLGKTIEAGMVIKEYLMRGLVRSVLVLAPPGLVQQWRDEMSAKFSLPFTLWGDRGVSEGDTDGLLLTIGSIASARMGRNRDLLTEKEWDLVVVDEAHHLRRRSTRSWTLVNALRKRFLLLLSATPVHGDLMELYELVTLVRPGLLGTPAEFRRRFLADARGRRAKDPEKLREILSEVMVRNTRSHADVVLPKRFATTLVLQPGVAEANACRAASTYARLVYSKLDPLARTRL
ncbi:MAG TPA: SNF2-related protein, partial [Candidatus Polarisedimenticolia bacterium]|nr:SNF2-related protein [Candidatus Polarisedimenticolia bacterium]